MTKVYNICYNDIRDGVKCVIMVAMTELDKLQCQLEDMEIQLSKLHNKSSKEALELRLAIAWCFGTIETMEAYKEFKDMM